MKTHFIESEWNALVNRALATLRAQRSCRAGQMPDSPCPDCPLAGSSTSCRSRFRATEYRLAALLRTAPAPYRHQLRRTMDGLELAYRTLWQGNGPPP